jgi:hypothetical protein
MRPLVADSYHQRHRLRRSDRPREQIDCEFERLDGYLYARLHRPVVSRTLDKEYAATTRRAGVRCERSNGCRACLSTPVPACALPGQAQFHPLNYLDGLAARSSSAAGVIHGATRALDDRPGDGREHKSS